MTMDIEIGPLESGRDQAWDNFVYRHPDSGHCHLSGWQKVIQQTYRHCSYYLRAVENGEIKGILPLFLMKSLLFGNTMVSMPFLDDGGICSDNEDSRQTLYDKARELFIASGAYALDLRHRDRSSIDLPSHGSKVTLTLSLSADPDSMWKQFNAKLRNQTRKAMKSGLTCSWHGIDGLPEFYDVFAINMRELGSPVHSYNFFANILKAFSESAQLILVRKGEKTIGGGLFLVFKDRVQMPWASANREYFSFCPNNILYWEAIRWACEKGYKQFDFGRSSPGSGTYYFKKQWGAVDRPLYWQCLTKNPKGSPTVRADDPQYRWAVRVWRNLPLAVTNSIGPFLRRQMSN